MRLWTVGYGAWPTATRPARLIEALASRGVTRLVDVRLSPCAANIDPGHPYGPRPWNLQAPGLGIAELLRSAGIAYEWMVELGNPQRQDPVMTVLRAHLADPDGGWPVHRGLARLAERVREPDAVVAILCACAEARSCHRTVIGHALADRHFAGRLEVRDVLDGPAPPS